MMIYSLKQRVFMVKRYYQNGNSTEKVKNEFVLEYNNQPTDDNIVELVQLFENFGSVNVKLNGDTSVKFEVNLDPIKLEGDSKETTYNKTELRPANILKEDPLSNDTKEPCWYSEIDNSNQYSDGGDKSVSDSSEKIETSISTDVQLVETSKFEVGDDTVNMYEQSSKIHDQLTFEQTNFMNDRSPLKCEVCDKEFRTKLLLQHHLKIHAKKKSGDKIACNICEKTYVSKKVLKQHIDAIHIGTKPYKCPMCDNKYYSKKSLIIHKRVHTGEKPFLCSYCTKPFGDSTTCKRHELTHTGERPYTCTVCFTPFRQASHLKTHLINVHKQENNSQNYKIPVRNPIHCKVCDKIISCSLKVHMRKHTGEKPYKCQICDKQYGSSTNLTIHNRTHTGEKPYVCDMCGKAFIANNLLKLHYHNIHTTNKPYHCSNCDKKFNNKKSLTIHERTHTGEKPYSCSHCSKSFADLGTCRRHERTHTGEKPYKCTICEKAFGQTAHLKFHMTNVHKHLESSLKVN